MEVRLSAVAGHTCAIWPSHHDNIMPLCGLACEGFLATDRYSTIINDCFGYDVTCDAFLVLGPGTAAVAEAWLAGFTCGRGHSLVGTELVLTEYMPMFQTLSCDNTGLCFVNHCLLNMPALASYPTTLPVPQVTQACPRPARCLTLKAIECIAVAVGLTESGATLLDPEVKRVSSSVLVGAGTLQ
jgi:hypothetical protein